MDFDVTSEAGIIWIERRNCEERCYKLSELEGGDVYKIDEKLMQEKKITKCMDLKITVFCFSLFFKKECEYIVAEFWKLL